MSMHVASGAIQRSLGKVDDALVKVRAATQQIEVPARSGIQDADGVLRDYLDLTPIPMVKTLPDFSASSAARSAAREAVAGARMTLHSAPGYVKDGSIFNLMAAERIAADARLMDDAIVRINKAETTAAEAVGVLEDVRRTLSTLRDLTD